MGRPDYKERRVWFRCIHCQRYLCYHRNFRPHQVTCPYCNRRIDVPEEERKTKLRSV